MLRDKVIVVGGGVFGLSAATELAARGYRVELLEAGEIPHPLAASTDISKVCRMEYGADEAYMAWAEAAREAWLEWNDALGRQGKSPLYHDTGVLMVRLDPMERDSFEGESFRLLEARGHSPERLGGRVLRQRFPDWSEEFRDGFFHAQGGWLESARVVQELAVRARDLGVRLFEYLPVESLAERGGPVEGVRLAGGATRFADRVVLACGSWTEEILPELRPSLRRTYHPVWHLRPEDPTRFLPERFPVFTADVSRTGFYGFPLHPERGVVKVAHHGEAVASPPDGSLRVSDDLTARLFAFLERYLPALADSELVYTRLCPYCDTQDEDFWIATDPDRPGLTVASGGSGHGLKFTPLLGAVIADAIEGAENPLLPKFAWRPELRLERGREAARCHDVSIGHESRTV